MLIKCTHVYCFEKPKGIIRLCLLEKLTDTAFWLLLCKAKKYLKSKHILSFGCTHIAKTPRDCLKRDRRGRFKKIADKLILRLQHVTSERLFSTWRRKLLQQS